MSSEESTMNKRVWMVLSAVLFAIALIFPVYMMVDAISLANYVVSNPLDDTGVQQRLQEQTVAHQTLLIVLSIAEVIVVVLFALCLRVVLKP